MPDRPTDASTADNGRGFGDADAFLEIELAMVGGRSSAVGAVVWKRDLPGGLKAENVAALHVGTCFVAFVSAKGRVWALNALGEPTVDEQLPPPVGSTPRLPAKGLAAWSGTQALLMQPNSGTVDKLSFASEARYLACAADLSRVCVACADERIRCYDHQGSCLWERREKQPVTGIMSSPNGEFFLVSDESGRHRYLSAQGKLCQKYRFGKGEYRPWGLGDDLSIYGSDAGALMMLDATGNQVWCATPLGPLTDVELLDDRLSVYAQSGDCASVDAWTGDMWRLAPPPGTVRVRRPPNADPVLFHAVGRAVTAYSGYRAKLETIWRYEHDAEIEALEVDREGRLVVVCGGATAVAIRGIPAS